METKLEDKMKELNVVGEKEMQKEKERVHQKEEEMVHKEEDSGEEIAGTALII